MRRLHCKELELHKKLTRTTKDIQCLYTLPRSGVESYNYHESNKDPNEALGQHLFLYMYIVNTLTTYFFGIFLYRLLLKVYDSEIKGKNTSSMTHFKFSSLQLLFWQVLTDMGYYIYNWNNLNVFTYLKVVFITMLFMGWVLLITVYYCKSDKLRSNIIRLVLVGLHVLTHETVLIILSIFPTLLLLFSQLSNTFALLVIHVALLYTETIAGVLVIEQLNKNMWIQKLLHKCKCCTCKCKRTQGQETLKSKDN